MKCSNVNKTLNCLCVRSGGGGASIYKERLCAHLSQLLSNSTHKRRTRKKKVVPLILISYDNSLFQCHSYNTINPSNFFLCKF